MNQEHEFTDMGSQIGNAAVDHVAQRAEDYCECERQRIELTNRARINALHVEGARLTKDGRQLEERLRLAPPPGDARSRKLKARYQWVIGGILGVAAFFFSLIAFAPYRLGWPGYLYCLGIALITPFALEEFLEAWKSEKLFKGIVTAVLVAALAGGALLAAIRGDLLSQQVQQSTPAVVIDGADSTSLQPQTSFYDSTRGSLRILMMLLALAIDLGAGVAVHRALLLGSASGEDHDKLSRELAEVQSRIAATVDEITTLTNAPAIFEARFWRDFYRAMLTQTIRKATTKLLGLSLCLLLFGGGRSFAQERLDLVVAVDLTASEAVKGHDPQTQFEKNIVGVGRLLALVPAGSKVTVIGITEDSFAQPYILLSADVSANQGYFGERLAAARQQMVRAWQKRAAQLEPRARRSDVLGALLTASELFREVPTRRRNVLVIYSDMRHVNSELDLETPVTIHVDAMLAIAERRKLLANLMGDAVYVLGADAAGKRVAQWEALKQFWTAYFKMAGANLMGYSILGEPPQLGVCPRISLRSAEFA